MNTSRHPEFFDFEQDFAGSLRCIPMRVRLKLDLSGIKLTLRQWSRFLPDERVEALRRPAETENDLKVYREFLLHLIEARADEPVKYLKSNEQDLWRNDNSVPDCIIAQAERDSISPPSAKQWRRISPLERFVLVKLARSSHENENFRPAMIEFGLL